MKRNVGKFLKFVFPVSLCFFVTGCALFGGDEEPVQKNPNISYQPPSSPFVKLDSTNADAAWQSPQTGNTIAINSTCTKDQANDLKVLEKNILTGFDHSKIVSETTLKVAGQDARRVLAEGTADNVFVRADLVTLEKGECTYDLAYIARTKVFDDEHAAFDKFIERFHIP